MKQPLLVIAAMALTVAAARAQEPIRVGLRVSTETSPSTPGGGYDDGSRRDPFVSLIAPKRAEAVPGAKPTGTGLKSLSISEVKVTGIQNLGARTALLEGPDGKTFVARAQDRLFDGIVKSIEADAVVFTERVADAVGAVHPRDVRKMVRNGGEGGR